MLIYAFTYIYLAIYKCMCVCVCLSFCNNENFGCLATLVIRISIVVVAAVVFVFYIDETIMKSGRCCKKTLKASALLQRINMATRMLVCICICVCAYMCV